MTNLKFSCGTIVEVSNDDAVIIIPPPEKGVDQTIFLPKNSAGEVLPRNHPRVVATVLSVVMRDPNMYHEICDKLFGKDKSLVEN